MRASCPTGTSRRRRFHPWVVAHRTTALVFLVLLLFGGQAWVWPYFHGSVTATTLFGQLALVDPLASLEAFAAGHALPATTLLGSGLLVLAALLAGPIFCGWVCPLGLLLDLNHALRRVVLRLFTGRKRAAPVPRSPSPRIRSAILGGLLGFAVLAQIPLFQVVSPINMIVRVTLFGEMLGLSILAGLLVAEWFLPRLWCRALCPAGALYSLLGRWAPWRIYINPAEAGKVRCQQCQVRCPMGIDIMDEYTLQGARSVHHPACIRCGECVDICPKKVLSLRLRPFPDHPADAGTQTPPVLPTIDGRKAS